MWGIQDWVRKGVDMCAFRCGDEKSLLGFVWDNRAKLYPISEFDQYDTSTGLRRSCFIPLDNVTSIFIHQCLVEYVVGLANNYTSQIKLKTISMNY